MPENALFLNKILLIPECKNKVDNKEFIIRFLLKVWRVYHPIFSSVRYTFLSEALRTTNSAIKPVRKNKVPMTIAVSAI